LVIIAGLALILAPDSFDGISKAKPSGSSYFCAGCVPNHRIDLMLIDPVDLVPISNAVSITNGGGDKAGGLLQRQAVVLGSSVLVTYNLTFHVHATAGSAVFVCDNN